ncbi:thiol S-methyltransferase TMT1B-like [Liolophura sinensis]|uniref:thiol S-methyltransferase TMT1B-like n=1 Tax=Liolophura sinensis TaxID=3198878 RepID=UPI003158C664
MAQFDASLKTILLNILGPLLVLMLLFLLLRKPLQSLKRRFFAYFINRMTAGVNKKLGNDKEELFGPLVAIKGSLKDRKNLTLLEIGAGGGANFKYYPRGTNIVCVDPNPHFESYLKSNSSEFPHVKLREFIVAKGEDMSEVPDSFCDAAVCTLVLCSVEDTDQLLKEVKRVLKPGGMFFFLEHVAAQPSTWSYCLQCFLTPVFKIIAEGCHLNRETWRNIEQAGFANLEYRRYTTSSWMPPLWHLMSGNATK